MAFRLPAAAPQRQSPVQQRHEARRPASLQRPLDQSQEWVLFSPTQTQAYTPTVETLHTAGASRLSDFGSLNSAVPPSEEQEQDEADDLDSLDDGLHEFREPLRTPGSSRYLDHSGGAVLPGHDGLGSFNASSLPAQEQIWQHERFNPRRRPTVQQRTPSHLSQHLDTIEEPDADHPFVEDEKLDRIERWRLDQSRVMLEEVQKEARRRRRLSLTGQSRAQSTPAAMDTTDMVKYDPAVASAAAEPQPAEESETFWQRITRRVIKDFMGIDEPLLSVILGESLADEDDLSSTPKAFDSETISKHLENESQEHLVEGWEDRLLRRLARELDIIVHSLTDHPGTFSTYAKPETFDYAGIPIQTRKHPPIPEQEVLELGQTPKAFDSPSALFRPTLQQSQDETDTTASEHEAGWGIEDGKREANEAEAAELEYWERTPDLKQVFAYLSRRFLKRTPQPPASFSDMSSSQEGKTRAQGIATHSTPASMRRAAIIRQHHPLVSRAHQASLAKQNDAQNRPRRLSLKSIAERLEKPAASECGRETISGSLRSLKRTGDDCASQSTKKSKTSKSRQHYWGMGSDSAAAALGGMGSWGEV